MNIKKNILLLINVITIILIGCPGTTPQSDPGTVETIQYQMINTNDTTDALDSAKIAGNYETIELDPLKRYALRGFIGIGGKSVDYYLCVTFSESGSYKIYGYDVDSITLDFFLKNIDETLVNNIPGYPSELVINVTAGDSYLIHMYKGFTGYAATTSVIIEPNL